MASSLPPKLRYKRIERIEEEEKKQEEKKEERKEESDAKRPRIDIEVRVPPITDPSWRMTRPRSSAFFRSRQLAYRDINADTSMYTLLHHLKPDVVAERFMHTHLPDDNPMKTTLNIHTYVQYAVTLAAFEKYERDSRTVGSGTQLPEVLTVVDTVRPGGGKPAVQERRLVRDILYMYWNSMYRFLPRFLRYTDMRERKLYDEKQLKSMVSKNEPFWDNEEPDVNRVLTDVEFLYGILTGSRDPDTSTLRFEFFDRDVPHFRDVLPNLIQPITPMQHWLQGMVLSLRNNMNAWEPGSGGVGEMMNQLPLWIPHRSPYWTISIPTQANQNNFITNPPTEVLLAEQYYLFERGGLRTPMWDRFAHWPFNEKYRGIGRILFHVFQKEDVNHMDLWKQISDVLQDETEFIRDVLKIDNVHRFTPFKAVVFEEKEEGEVDHASQDSDATVMEGPPPTEEEGDEDVVEQTDRNRPAVPLVGDPLGVYHFQTSGHWPGDRQKNIRDTVNFCFLRSMTVATMYSQHIPHTAGMFHNIRGQFWDTARQLYDTYPDFFEEQEWDVRTMEQKEFRNNNGWADEFHIFVASFMFERRIMVVEGDFNQTLVENRFGYMHELLKDFPPVFILMKQAHFEPLIPYDPSQNVQEFLDRNRREQGGAGPASKFVYGPLLRRDRFFPLPLEGDEGTWIKSVRKPEHPELIALRPRGFQAVYDTVIRGHPDEWDVLRPLKSFHLPDYEEGVEEEEDEGGDEGGDGGDGGAPPPPPSDQQEDKKEEEAFQFRFTPVLSQEEATATQEREDLLLHPPALTTTTTTERTHTRRDLPKFEPRNVLTRFSQRGENRRRGEKDPNYESIKKQLLPQILTYTDKLGNLRYVTTERFRGAPKIFTVRIADQIVRRPAKEWSRLFPQIFDDAYNYGAEEHARLGYLSTEVLPPPPPPGSVKPPPPPPSPPPSSPKDKKKHDKKKDEDEEEGGPSAPAPGAGAISIHEDLKRLREEQAQKDREAREEQIRKEFQNRMAQLNAEEQHIRDTMAAESLSASDMLFHQLRLLTLEEQKKKALQKLEQEETKYRSDLATEEQERTNILSQARTLLPKPPPPRTPTPLPHPTSPPPSPRKPPDSDKPKPNIFGKLTGFTTETIDTAMARLRELRKKTTRGTKKGKERTRHKARVIEETEEEEEEEEQERPPSPQSFSVVLKPPKTGTTTRTETEEETRETEPEGEAFLLNPPSITEPTVPSSSREDDLRAQRHHEEQLRREIEEQQRRLEEEQKEMQEFERLNTIRQQEAVIARYKEADEARNSMKVDLGSIPVTTVVAAPAPGGGDPGGPGAGTVVAPAPEPTGIPPVTNEQLMGIAAERERLGEQMDTWRRFQAYMNELVAQNQRMGQRIEGNTFPMVTTLTMPPSAPTTTTTVAAPPSEPPPPGPGPSPPGEAGSESDRGESEREEEDEPERRGPESETDGEGEEPPSEEPPPSSTPQSNWPLLFTPPTVFRAPDTEEARRNGGYNPASDVLHVPMMWRSLHSQLREALIGLPRSQAHARARNARSSDFAPERNPYPHIP